MSTDQAELRRKLEAIPGVTLEHSKRNQHTKVYWHGQQVTAIPASPRGGRRWRQNCIAQLRRAGIPV